MTRAFKISEEIEIPENIQVNIENLKVKISGPKGSLQRDFSHGRRIGRNIGFLDLGITS